ncbi:acyl-coenzyme A thioesterase THEM4-like [Heteronotia binoei]|uniref:acyl-coenzyme A thioesterase THEM4-like n=1 Tax=Heteronotia binoei TaxID=13085 RepID=UPI0029316970|nr:acyl-coenzyme A thioesterase THEM4-like [Heteronotia binoei]
MLRSCGHLTKCLHLRVSTRGAPWVVASKGVSPLSSNAVRPLPASELKDYALPNSSWSRDMTGQFNKFAAMTEDGTWRRIPSHRRVEDSAPEYIKQKLEEQQKKRDTRYFCRSIDQEGLGFEYVMFFNSSQKRMMGIFQLGPYLEGPPGFVHGGSIATILDATLSLCALFATGAILTANLSINYKSPVRLGSVVLVDGKVDKVEGRKAFLSGPVQSADGQTLHAEGRALIFQLDSHKPLYEQQLSSQMCFRAHRTNPRPLLSLGHLEQSPSGRTAHFPQFWDQLLYK